MATYDPASYPGTKLPGGGPSALDVAFKRKGIEAQQGRQKAARAAQERAAKQKMFELDMETAFLPHTQYFGSKKAAYIDLAGDLLEGYKSGRNDNPLDPGSESWNKIQHAQANIKQEIANSNQVKDIYTKMKAGIDKNPNKYKPAAAGKLQAWATDPRTIAGQTEFPTLDEIIDQQKIYNTHYGQYTPEQRAKAFTTKEGRVFEEKVKFLSDDRIREGAIALTNDELLNRKKLEDFQLLAQQNPTEAQRITEEAEENGWPVVTQMIYEDNEPRGYEQATKTIKGAGYGAGAMRRMAAAGNFLKILAGLEEGNPDVYEDPRETGGVFGVTAGKEDYQVSTALKGRKVTAAGDQIAYTLRKPSTGEIGVVTEDILYDEEGNKREFQDIEPEIQWIQQGATYTELGRPVYSQMKGVDVSDLDFEIEEQVKAGRTPGVEEGTLGLEPWKTGYTESKRQQQQRGGFVPGQQKGGAFIP